MARIPRLLLIGTAGGGGAVTLTAGAGAVSLSGIAAGLTTQRKATAAAVSFALTGIAVTPKIGRALAADVRAYSLAGQASGLTAQRRLTADVCAYALTGIAANLTKVGSFALSADAAGFTLTGQAATLRAARQLVADASTYALTGNAAGLTKTSARSLTAETGTFALAGQAATLLPYQHAYPVSDVSAGDWQPSSGSDLFAMLDEGYTPNAADYIFTNTLSTARVSLGLLNDPGTDSGITFNYQARGDGSTDLVVRLKQGATTIATWTEANAAATDTLYAHSLTTGEAAAINWATALDLELEAA
jgi:hypothetical protein